jgi:hypothetical protein
MEAVALDRDALREELRNLNRRSRTGFFVCMGMLLIIFALAIAGVIIYHNEPSRIGAIFAASGVTITGIVTATTKLWTQRTKSEMVVALVGSLDQNALQAALQSLLSTL